MAFCIDTRSSIIPVLLLLLKCQAETFDHEEEEVIWKSLHLFRGSAKEFIFLLENLLPSFYKFPQWKRNNIAWNYFQASRQFFKRKTWYLDSPIRRAMNYWPAAVLPNLLEILRIIFRDIVFTTCPPEFESYSEFLASYELLDLPNKISNKLGEYQVYVHGQDQTQYRAMFQFFQEILVGGLDMNHVYRRQTLLEAFVSGLFVFGPTTKAVAALNSSLRFWLADLQASGVNLRRLGKEQERLFRELGGPSTYICDEAFGSVQLIGFSHGPSPGDWCLWIAENSHYFAADFWDMIERRMEMPGGWPSDVHLFL